MCCAPNLPVNFAVSSPPPNPGAGNLDFVWGCESGSIANWKIGRGSLSELAPVALGAEFLGPAQEKREVCALSSDSDSVGDQLL